jgi:hypothetical protein
MSASTIVAVLLCAMTFATNAAARAPCDLDAIPSRDRSNASVEELRAERAEAKKRWTALQARIASEERKARPDLDAILRLHCSLLHELALLGELSERLKPYDGCFLIGYPPRCR